MNAIVRAGVAVSMGAALWIVSEAAAAQPARPSAETDMYAPANSTKLMPDAALGRQYPTHGNQQAGELNLNPSDPRAQLVNGLPNNALSGGYGSPLAGNKANVKQAVPPGE
ncbi:hypothetical protein B0G84_3824 [Paraburkholderia sp. BL8N3]|nr:hypothetical protein B0G84_3824 [Paraburkholderia sp. BL8N3]